jgi:photosystem II stability/assembly factor-like uncharacterized protein
MHLRQPRMFSVLACAVASHPIPFDERRGIGSGGGKMFGMLWRWLLGFVVALTALSVLTLGTHAAPQAAPPANTWVNVTGTLANKPSECGTITLLSPVPRSDTIIAGVAGKGLWANNRGSTWVQLGESDKILNRPLWIVYDPAHPGVFWESGIYGSAGVYQTKDRGNTFRRLGSIFHNDYVSVDLRDPERATLLAGGHEQGQTVYQSTDGGQTWTNIGLTLPAKGASTNPLVIDSNTYLVNAEGVGIYRTTNGGTSWRRVSGQGPSGPPLVTANGTIYWPANGGLLKSTDAGTTWAQVGTDIRPVHPIELSDGKLVSVGTTRLVISADGGSTWTAFGAPLPFTPAGLIYAPGRRGFFIWRSDCQQTVPSDAVMAIY